LLGDYKTALELADEQVEALEKEHPSLVMKEKYTEGLPALKEGSTPLINEMSGEYNVPDYVIYIYMKFRLL